MTDPKHEIPNILLKYLSGVQAIYLFGSLPARTEHDRSDVDIAVLLVPEQSKHVRREAFLDARTVLEADLHRDTDLINLRQADTVLQKEVVNTGERIYCSDEYAAEEFEMLVLSEYQKLSRERADIVEEILVSGRVLAA